MTLAALDGIEEEFLETQVCIIGAGAAGITLACELDGAGFKVLLLEAGGLKLDGSQTDYYAGTATAPHADPTQFRRTIFGGTTGIWGGRCVPYDPVDFEARDYVAHSGWPINYEEVAKHYPAALKYCDAGKFDFSIQGSLESPVPTISGFEGSGADGSSVVLNDRIERYSLPTDFGRRYRQKLEASANVTALTGARCLKLSRAPGEERIRSAHLIDRGGRRREIRAATFVLATGGIEVPRLLMLSDEQGPGLGNQGDTLGRFYQCHFENTFGKLVPHGANVKFKFERSTDGVYCRRQLRFSPGAQRANRLLNTAFRLHFPAYSDASHGSSVMSGIYLAKSMLISEYRTLLAAGADAVHSPTSAHVRNVLTGLPQLMSFAADWLFRIQLAHRKLPYTLIANADGTYPVEFNCEQTPLASNRVSLAPEVDRDGLRRVRIDWRMSDEDTEAACRAYLLLQDTFTRSGQCRLEFDESRLRERMRSSVPLGGHHIGTARMAASQRSGVVNGDCAVFGAPNVYVASSAVFPTSSHANPTLTIVAMAVRLAAHLRGRLAA